MLLKDESSDEPQTVDTATVAAAVTAAGVVIVLVDAVVTAPPPPPLDCVPVVAVATLFVRFPSDEMLVDDGNALALTAVVRGIVD